MTDDKKEIHELNLHLCVTDSNVIRFLVQYDESLRNEKAMEALRVGVVALQSASPILDTRIVEDKFRELDTQLKGYVEEFKENLTENLATYFEKEKGDVPNLLNSFLGDRGRMWEFLKQYFDPEQGKLKSLLENELGAGSNFSRALDPSNKSSVISLIEKSVEQKLEESITSLVKEFSLDKDDSGISRIKKVIENNVTEIKSINENFFNELRAHFNIQQAVIEEAAKGTQKGRDFETFLYDYVAQLGSSLQDKTENVTGLVGAIPRMKTGDYVMTLGETSGAPEKRIVIEVKKEQGYRFKDAVEELKQAKENREAGIGIFVFSKGYEPPEVGNFRMDGNDFYITVDESMLEEKKPLLFLEAAYQIARVLLVLRLRKAQSGQVDLDGVKRNIKKMLDQVELMEDLIKKAKTIQNSGENIEKTALTIKSDLEQLITTTLQALT